MTATDLDLTDFASIPGGFVAIRGYTTREGEVSNYLINGGVNYATYNERRRAFLVAALVVAREVTVDSVIAACPAADISLCGKTIQARYGGDTRAYVAGMIVDVVQGYEGSIGRIDGNEGDWAAPAVQGAVAAAEMYEAVAAGVKRHVETGELHVYGLLARKVQVAPPTKVSVPRADTLVKNFIRHAAEKDLDCPAWVQFRLGEDNWSAVAFAGRRVENTTNTAAIAAAK